METIYACSPQVEPLPPNTSLFLLFSVPVQCVLTVSLGYPQFIVRLHKEGSPVFQKVLCAADERPTTALTSWDWSFKGEGAEYTGVCGGCAQWPS
jgi:hypothetical protein